MKTMVNFLKIIFLTGMIGVSAISVQAQPGISTLDKLKGKSMDMKGITNKTCSGKPDTNDVYKKVYYFYDEDHVLKKHQHVDVTIYAIITTVTMHPESKYSYKAGIMYQFNHFKEDTSFIKPKSFLKKIDYFDSEWLKKDSNLKYFWNIPNGSRTRSDRLKIYLIEKVENSDSLLFMRVNRSALRPE